MNQKTMNQQITNQRKPISSLNEEFKHAHGKIPYGMTNDYMFRAVLQTNNKALRGLICSLLHLRHEDVLCRSLNMLTHGQEYQELKPVIHIGFLNYTLFDDYPEFYATYKLMNVKNHHIYSDKLTLSVIDLSHIELATSEDRKYKIDNWAKLFKATTWEEIKMLAAEDQYIDEASKSIFQLSAEEQKAELADKDAQIQKLLTEVQSLRAAAANNT